MTSTTVNNILKKYENNIEVYTDITTVATAVGQEVANDLLNAFSAHMDRSMDELRSIIDTQARLITALQLLAGN